MILNDVSRWPLVVVRVDDGPTTKEHVAAFVASQRAMLARREPFVEIADAMNASVISAVERRLLADWLKESEPLAAPLCVGIGVLVSSPIVRGALNAVLWLKSPVYPMHVCSSDDDAVSFLRGAVRTDGRIPHAVAKLDEWRGVR
jgi:hypothetical protein